MSGNSGGNTTTSPTKPSPPSNIKSNRLPAPTLFVGPASRNASQLSIIRTTTHDSSTKSTRDVLNRQKLGLARTGTNPDADAKHASNTNELSNESHPVPKIKKASEKAVNSRWKELQSTLNEVELTAQSSTHVFGSKHASALDELRRAQVELARAWGRGNEAKAPTTSASETDPDHTEEQKDMNRLNHVGELGGLDRPQQRKRGLTESSASTALTDESSYSDATPRAGTSQLEDETAQDIRLASERRAANEAYFKKVDSSVRDVVAKLEVVAEAMRNVEEEARSLWSPSESSSNPTGSGGGNEFDKANATG